MVSFKGKNGSFSPIVLIGIALLILLGTFLVNSTRAPKPANFTPVNNEIPTDIPVQTAPSISDVAKKDLTSFVNAIIVSELRSPTFLEKDMTITANNVTSATTSWTANGNEFAPTLNYNSSNVLTDKQLLISLSQPISALNPSTASSVGKQYLILAPQKAFSCITLPSRLNSTLCESFWQERDGTKKGLDITSPVIGNKAQIFYCERKAGSPYYDWQSCNPNFKDTGVK